MAVNNQNRKVLIAGAGGFVGKKLVETFTQNGFDVVELSRKNGAGKVCWDIEKNRLNPDDVEGFDAFVCLSGENIFGLWSGEKKRKILESRVGSANLLSMTISKLRRKPKVFVCASAVGYYGISADTRRDESSPRGNGFLALVCGAWENAASNAEKFGVRTVFARFAAVLDPSGGMIEKLGIAARLKISPYFGAPDDKFAWVALDDLAAAVLFCVENENMRGAVNIASPVSASKSDFAQEFAKSRNAWFVLRIPRIFKFFAGGEMAENLMYSDLEVYPQKLLEAGFRFRCPSISSALKN